MMMMSLQHSYQQIPQQQHQQATATATAATVPPTAEDVFPSQLLMELNQQGLAALSSHDFDEAIQLIRQGLTLLQSYCRLSYVDGSTIVPNLTIAPAELALFPLHQQHQQNNSNCKTGETETTLATATDRFIDHNILALSPTVFCVHHTAALTAAAGAPAATVPVRLDVLSAAVLYNLAYACQTKALVFRALSATPTYDPCTQQLLLSHQELQHEFLRADRLYRMAAAAAHRAWQQEQEGMVSPPLLLVRLLLPLCNNRAHVAMQLFQAPLAQQCLQDLQALLGQQHHHHHHDEAAAAAAAAAAASASVVGINEMMLNVLQWNGTSTAGLRSAPAA